MPEEWFHSMSKSALFAASERGLRGVSHWAQVKLLVFAERRDLKDPDGKPWAIGSMKSNR